MASSDYLRWSNGLPIAGEEITHRPHDAATRLTDGGTVDIQVASKFKIDKDAKVFCIGSCFAREIEIAMMANGSDVLSAQIDIADYDCEPHFFPNHNNRPQGIFTKFNSYSMAQEIERALNNTQASPDDFVEIDGKYWDSALHQMPLFDLETCLKTRRMVDGTFQRLRESDLVIITLGLTEMWWDNEMNAAMNDGPFSIRMIKNSDRYKFKNANFHEVTENVRKIIADLQAINPDVNIIMTVSPVPLHRTFSDVPDIIVANSYSKSLLRAVAGETSREYDCVDYFPSYEIVTNSPRDIAWLEDQRHVNPRLVQDIMRKFIDEYMTDG